MKSLVFLSAKQCIGRIAAPQPYTYTVSMERYCPITHRAVCSLEFSVGRYSIFPRLLLFVLSAILVSGPFWQSLAQAQDATPQLDPVGIMPTQPANGPDFVPGSLIVRFAPGNMDRRAALNMAESVQALPLLPDTLRLRVQPGQETQIAAQLAADPAVLLAEPEYIFYKTATPNDTLYQRYQWNLRHTRADQGWDRTTGSADVIVAVVDTGVDLAHPDLAGKMVAGYDVYNNDPDPSDDDGHGTHVASVAAANSNNGQGMAGMSWGGRLMPVKVLGANGSGGSSQVATGIIWATDHGARIINLSLGSPNYSALVNSAITYAHSRGVLVVAAAGNHYQEGNPTIYPAAYNNVLAVGATNDSDGHASYSSSGSFVDVAAPGGDPSSSADGNLRHWIVGAYWRGKGRDYVLLSGTSQAAPQVAGLAALLLSLNPSLSPDQLTDVITRSAVDVQAPGWDEFSGYGRIDVLAALTAVGGEIATPTPTPTPTATSTYTPGPTPTPTLTPSPTVSPTPTLRPTPTFTPTPTVPPRNRDDVRINSAVNNHQADAAVVVDGAGNLTAIWRDGRTGIDALYAADMPMSASAWGPNIAVASTQARPPANVTIGAPSVASGPAGELYAVWQDVNSSDDPDIYFSQRSKAGSWSTAIQINDDLPDGVEQRNPRILSAGGVLVVVWVDGRPDVLERGNTNLYWTERKAGSTRWSASRPVYEFSTQQREPALAVSGSTIFLAWIESDILETRLMVSQKEVSAIPWSAPMTVQTLRAAGIEYGPGLAVDGTGRVLLAWADAVEAGRGTDIFSATYSSSLNGWSAPVRINDDRGDHTQRRPRVMGSAGGFVAVWEDERAGNPDIMAAWQPVGGGWSANRRINRDEGDLPQRSPDVAMDAYGHTTVVWTDHRTGVSAPEVYARFLLSTERYGLHLPVIRHE